MASRYPDWIKPWAVWADLRTGPAPSRRLDSKPLEVPSKPELPYNPKKNIQRSQTTLYRPAKHRISWWSAQPQQLVLNFSHSLSYLHIWERSLLTATSHPSLCQHRHASSSSSSIPAVFLVLHGHACSFQVARATPGMADGSTKASDSSFLHARQAQTSWRESSEDKTAQITREHWQSSSHSISSTSCLFSEFCLPPTPHSHSPSARNHELHRIFPLTPPLHNGPRLQRRSYSSWMLQNPWILLQHSLQHRRDDLFTLDSTQNYLFCLETACDGVSLCMIFNSSLKCQEARGHEHSAKTTSLQFKSDNNLPADSFGKRENPTTLFAQLVTFIVLLERRQSITQILEEKNSTNVKNWRVLSRVSWQ